MQIRIWDEQEWRASSAVYSQLLAESSADPLFMSWDWLSLWWELLPGRMPDERLTVHAAYESGKLVGALAIVSGTVVRRGGLRYRSAQVLGNRILDERGALSEYLDVVAAKGREEEVLKACLESVLKFERCSEIAISWCRSGREWKAAIDTLERPWGYTRVVDPLRSYQADLSQGFNAYLASLSSNARRSLFNLRRKLPWADDTNISEIPAENYPEALNELNRLHGLRWDAPALDGATLRVHEELIRRWSGQDRIRFSQIEIGGRRVSILYDIRIGTTQYNIQMGFDPGLGSISLGLLHLGYAMERAADEGVCTYDFLGGEGRATDYKRRIASHSMDVVSIQCLTNPFIAGIFRTYDLVRRRGVDRSEGASSHTRQ